MYFSKDANSVPTFESPWIHWGWTPAVHPKGGQSYVFTGRTNAEAETPVFWPPDVKS